MAKNFTEELRQKWVALVTEWARAQGEDVMAIKSNAIAFPVVDGDGNEQEIRITISVPKGKEGDDCYSLAQEYAAHQAEKQAKAQAAAKAKAEKIARDKAAREARAKAKAEHEASAN